MRFKVVLCRDVEKKNHFKDMSSFKIKFRPSTIVGKEGILYYQIIHQRVIRQVTTNFKLYSDEWDVKSESVQTECQNINRKNYLDSVQYKIINDKRRFESIVQRLAKQYGIYSVDTVKKNKKEAWERRKIASCRIDGQMQMFQRVNPSDYERYRQGLWDAVQLASHCFAESFLSVVAQQRAAGVVR